MANFIISSFLWFFAIYGFFELFKSHFNSNRNKNIFLNNSSIILTVHNQEENIEFFIKDSIYNLIATNIAIPNITIVDLNSTDNTFQILKIFSNDFSFINVLSLDEYISYLKLN